MGTALATTDQNGAAYALDSAGRGPAAARFMQAALAATAPGAPT